MTGIPTDVGPYAVLITLVILLAVGFGLVTQWLDRRSKQQKEEISKDFESRIAHLEDQVKTLLTGRIEARTLIVESIAELPPEQKSVLDRLVKAIAALA